MCDISSEESITTQSKCESLLARDPAIFKTLLLKVKRLKNMRNLNTFLLKYLNKGSYLALSVQSQVKLVKLIYIVDIIVIETQTCKVICIHF